MKIVCCLPDQLLRPKTTAIGTIHYSDRALGHLPKIGVASPLGHRWPDMVPPRHNLCGRAAPNAELAGSNELPPLHSLLPTRDFIAALP
jgi:hypothetical protein